MRLVDKLLGEKLKISSTRIRKDSTVLCDKTTLATAKFLNAITLPRYLMLNIEQVRLLGIENVEAQQAVQRIQQSQQERSFKISSKPPTLPNFCVPMNLGARSLSQLQKKVYQGGKHRISEESLALLLNNAIEKVKTGSPGFYSNIFTITNKTEYFSTHPYTSKLEKIPEAYAEQSEPTVQSSPIWAITEPTHIHQDIEANIDMSRKQGIRILLYLGNLLIMRSCKTIENRQDKFKKIRQFYWESSSDVCCTLTGLFNATTTSKIKGQDINKNKIMELHSQHSNSGYTELSLVKKSIKTLEWSIIHPRDAGDQRISIMIYSENTLSLASVKRQGGNTLEKITEDSRRHMGILHQDKHPPADNINRQFCPHNIDPFSLRKTMKIENYYCCDTRDNNIKNNNYSLYFGNMTSKTDHASKNRAINHKGVQNSVRSEKQEITTNQEQDMALISVKN
ncbi:hypothetical protein BB561_005884 [Smittium simulii]|uniref:Uncharacterized protein n=1 Tax=Smittium simulii TaxID=133385 RepID=A0A2T9Y7W0_9FUNG|nr:hypothetical protein BB561_005884 [Smittium simulii]